MKNKYLGIICIIYALIIIYVVVFGYLKNFLSPTMQKYILVSIPILIIMGIVMLLDKESCYKIKFSDLVLLLPLVLVIFAGSGRLTTTLSSNRSNSFKKSDINISKKSIKKDASEKKVDIGDIDFDVKDEAYSLLADGITYNSKPDNLVGKTVKVRGFVLKDSEGIPDRYFGIGKYVISCCAADASFSGFMAKYDLSKVKNNGWYEIEGVLEKGNDSYGSDILVINVKNIKSIDGNKEELYVYPCYSYGEDKCDLLSEYDIVF